MYSVARGREVVPAYRRKRDVKDTGTRVGNRRKEKIKFVLNN